jgi:hypothetical protein
MWISKHTFNGIDFELFGDWFGVNGFKVCLAVGEANIKQAIQKRGNDVLEALHFFSEHAEEMMLVGWASDPNFWWHTEKESLEEYERRATIIFDSEFTGVEAKAKARDALDHIDKAKRKQKARMAKSEVVKRRRSDFAKERDRLMLALIERDGYECAECGDVEGLSIDHIIPLSKGGSDDLDNLQLLCRGCNSSKGDKIP